MKRRFRLLSPDSDLLIYKTFKNIKDIFKLDTESYKTSEKSKVPGSHIGPRFPHSKTKVHGSLIPNQRSPFPTFQIKGARFPQWKEHKYYLTQLIPLH